MHAKRATSLALAAVVVLVVGTRAAEAKGLAATGIPWTPRLVAAKGAVARAAKATKCAVLAWEADLAMPHPEVEQLMVMHAAVRDAYATRVREHKDAHPYERSRPFALGGLLAWGGAAFAVAADQGGSAGDIALQLDSAWAIVKHHAAPLFATFSGFGIRIALADRLLKPHLEGLRAAAIAAVATSDATKYQGPGSRVLVSKRLRDVVTLLERATSGS